MDSHYIYNLSNNDERPLPPLPTSEIESSTAYSKHQKQENTPSSHSSQITSQNSSHKVKGDKFDSRPCHSESASKPSRRVAAHLRNSSHSSLSFLDESISTSESSPKINTNLNGNHNLFHHNDGAQSGGSRAHISIPNPGSNKQNSSPTGQDSLGPLRSISTSHSSENTPRTLNVLPRTSSLLKTSNQPEISETREVVMPRWQLDSEVNLCPICKSRFSFFLRKHHCRKCGRIICNSCSPHRITIPYHYIVQPPFQGEASTSTSEIQRSDFNHLPDNLGGGRQVRLCNPCVPDPNTAPQQIGVGLNDHHRNSITPSVNSTFVSPSESSLSVDPYYAREAYNSTSSNSPHHRQLGNSRNRAQTTSLNESSYSVSHYQRRDRTSRPVLTRNRSRSSPINTPAQFNNGNSSLIHIDTAPYQNRRSFSITNPHDRSLPTSNPSSRRKISEEDECWICHEELPSRSLENCDVLRAAHVNACIRLAIQLSSGTPRVNSPISTSLEEENSFVSEAEVHTTNPESPLVRRNLDNWNQRRNLNPSQGRRTRVFPYQAIEKDCIEDDECAICLEEFEVGAEMGRLECFCRFHLKCIREWFENRPGQCPVHQHCSGY